MLAVSCIGGQSLGNQSQLRGFDVQRIKGIKFEAVFFELIEAQPTQFE